MATAVDAAEEYRATLAELTNNNKTQINLLTILAEDYAQFASAIVQVIDAQILQVPPGQKLAVVYVADSIIKNVDQKAKYRELFGKSIVKTFVHVFDTGDEKTRMALYKLRLTWGDVFPRSKLYAIDIKVNQIDPAWPVLNPQPGASEGSDSVSHKTAAPSSSHTAIHVNPRFLPSATAPKSGVSADEEKLLRLQKQKEAQEAERNKLKAQIAEKERQIEVKNSRPQSVVIQPNDPRKAARQQLVQEQPAAAATTPVVNGQSAEADRNADRRTKTREERPVVDDASASSARSDAKGRKEILERYRRESDDSGSGEGRKSSKRNRTDDRSSRKRRSRSPPAESTKKHQKSPIISEVERSRSSRDSSPSTRRDSSDNHDSGKEKNLPPKKRVRSADMTEETSSGNESTERSHADGASAEKRTRPNHSPSGTLSPAVDKERGDDDGRRHSPNGGRYGRSGGQRRGGNNRQQTGSNASRGGRPKDHQPATYEPTATPGQHAFIAAPTPVPSQARFSGLLPTPPAPFVGGPPAHMPPPSAPAPFGGYGAPTPAPYPTATIITDGPKLEGIPANNRIFVDGKAYEVFYIDEVPVIERNGLPHRIYFTGPPRNVIIDGVAHSLAFGDKKNIIIDGQPHVVRFGAPSRELYMGDYPFRGAFGGPPIFATINGVRHEIRLGGPPPEVKIEPDPCYELLRHMPSRQVQPRGPLYDYGPTPPSQPMPVMSHLAPAPAPVQPQIDVGGLLERLVRSGMIKTPATIASPGQADASRSPQRPTTPPIPSQHQVAENEAIERRPQPPATLKDLSMRSLKIRYQSVIDALYQTQQRCPNCGLRFDDLKGEKYQRHLDWHFKENQRAQDPSRGVSRQWYFAVEDWINYTEQGDDPAGKAKSDVFEETNSRVEDAESNAVANAAVATVAASDMPSNQQNCAVCNEKFEEYWDEDDDAWRFKDCMVADGKAYHPTCYQDVSVVPGHQDSSFLPSAMDTSAFSGVPGLEITPPTPMIKDEPRGTSFDLPSKSVASDTDGVGLNDGHVMQVKEEPLSGDSGFGTGPLPGLGGSSPPPRSPGTPVRDEDAS